MAVKDRKVTLSGADEIAEHCGAFSCSNRRTTGPPKIGIFTREKVASGHEVVSRPNKGPGAPSILIPTPDPERRPSVICMRCCQQPL
ncbi:hypothetical protein F2P79_007196 [Pimephales promelas]|nr:hypothetical protein F2P79_007196 [Pimephales promelas]